MDNEIIFVTKGNAKVSLNGETRYVEQGQAVFCQSGTLHYINGEKDSLIDIFLFDNNLVEDITSRYVLADPVLKGNYNLDYFFDLIKNELANREDFYESRTNALIIYLISDIFRREHTQQLTDSTEKLNKSEGKTISGYKELLNHIDQSYEYLTFKDAATYMGLSETYFSKLFKNLCGMTFSQYLNVVRIEKAIELLSSKNSYSMTEIASTCGYSSIRHFNRSFLQITGYSPSALPSDYQLDFKQFKTVTDSFNPTLDESKLIT
ncbi:MAG: helix-turn-helix domain-containing protein [Clostridiales bacterium]|nr:helix-turn-helix domain-containing protein [Clostridiales bacterium]